mmetsp:Transcript_31801/g.62990  ORF Transcript_31801/g.62990 Transcript_31801/m.62990 type:complete len:80 (+) Transcript_31801:1753-1992(+)
MGTILFLSESGVGGEDTLGMRAYKEEKERDGLRVFLSHAYPWCNKFVLESVSAVECVCACSFVNREGPCVRAEEISGGE